MIRFVGLIAFAGCGRVGFEPIDSGVDTAADVLLGHDEDGDGVPDSSDTCPHIAAPQDDLDGDRVGDACDPRPGLLGDEILRFDTMTGSHPFAVEAISDGTFSQEADALRFTGTLGPDGNLYGGLVLPLMAGHVRVALGLDLLTIIPGSVTNQNQFALHANNQTPPLYFVELNQNLPNFDVAAITLHDGIGFFQNDPQDLANAIHPGPVFFQTTQVAGNRVTFEVGWPGEMYTAEVMDSVYLGCTTLKMDFNNIELEIRYMLVITSP